MSYCQLRCLTFFANAFSYATHLCLVGIREGGAGGSGQGDTLWHPQPNACKQIKQKIKALSVRVFEKESQEEVIKQGERKAENSTGRNGLGLNV